MSSASERRGLDLSAAPEDVQAVLNRIMHLEDECERYRKALWWAAEEMSNTADAIGPVPDLAERALRVEADKLRAVLAESK